MPQTILGKNNILFLTNDSSKEIECHCGNITLISDVSLSRYNSIQDKFFIVVFPDKSIYYKYCLPDEYPAIYRRSLDIYKQKFKHKLLDAYDILQNVPNAYYKTDTHINLMGGYHVYLDFINKINVTYKIGLVAKQLDISVTHDIELSSLNLGIGDLTWGHNLGELKLTQVLDSHYYCNGLMEFYMKYKISDKNIQFLDYNLNCKTETFNNHIVDWNIVSNHIIYTKNLNAMKRVVIFYDSFLLHHLQLYLDHFYEVWFIKSHFDLLLIGLINPDFVFEFRIERFLS